MLLSNRRIRLLFIALVGMEAAVLTPFLMLLFRQNSLWLGTNPLGGLPASTILLAVWVGLLGMLVAVDLLAHSEMADNTYRLTVVGLVVVTALIGVRLLIYPGSALLGLGWLVETGEALFNVHRGLRPAVAIFALVLFLWLRGSALSSREINFMGVGLSFRIGVLLLLLGGGVLTLTAGDGARDGLFVMAVYFATGLLAVALARSEDKAASAAGSSGTVLAWDRLLQMVFMVLLTVGGALLLGTLFTPELMRRILGLFSPLWELLGRLGLLLLIGVAYVMEWLVYWLLIWLAPLLENLDLSGALAGMMEGLAVEPRELEEMDQPTPWPYAGLARALVRIGLVGGALAVVLWLVYVLLARRRRGEGSADTEEGGREPITLGGDALQRAWARLRNLARLVGRYGVGRELLAAVSVENMYANLSRIARERGHPRNPSLAPDGYLPELGKAFPGQTEGLARITLAYMRVHYGDRALGQEELVELRQIYNRIRQAEPPEPEPPNDT